MNESWTRGAAEGQDRSGRTERDGKGKMLGWIKVEWLSWWTCTQGPALERGACTDAIIAQE